MHLPPHRRARRPAVQLSVIVPFLNEREVLPACLERLRRVDGLNESYEIVFVDPELIPDMVRAWREARTWSACVAAAAPARAGSSAPRPMPITAAEPAQQGRHSLPIPATSG